MPNPKIQIDELIREMNEQELKDYQEQQASNNIRQTEAMSKIEARQSALAKLAALGLTEAEIAAL
jgi:DNA-binding NarL/FixJ family response regulator